MSAVASARVASLAYAVVTPARDEAENLERLGASLARQTALPRRWIIVDTGSRDRTPVVVAGLRRRHDWLGSIRRQAAEMHPGGPVVRAFHEGLEHLGELPDVVVKLDADVTLDEDYFERLLREFAADPTLGIAGGVCFERVDGEWAATHVTGTHVRGAARAYRRECLEALLPLEERMGWDGLDELKADVLGWRTESIPTLRFYHHRPVGARDGARTARWVAQGQGAYFMGYRFSYLVLRSSIRAVRQRDPAALAMISAYVGALVRREPRYRDRAVVAHLREQQRITALPSRLRESLGHKAA